MLKKLIYNLFQIFIILICSYVTIWIFGTLFYFLVEESTFISYLSSALFCFAWIGLFFLIKPQYSPLKNIFLAIISLNGFLLAYAISNPFCDDTFNQFHYRFTGLILLLLAFYLTLQFILPKYSTRDKIIVGFASFLYAIDHIFFLIGFSLFQLF